MSNAVPRRTWSAYAWLGLLAVGAICLSAGCGKSDESAKSGGNAKFEVADENQGASGGGGADRGRKSGAQPAGGAASAGMSADTGAGTGTPGPPPSLSINQLEKIEVPDGTPEELLAFANQMGEKIMALRAESGGRIDGAAKTREIELFRAISTSADKILAANDANYDQRKAAIENKAGAMSLLSRLEPETDWGSKVRAFAATVASDKDPAIAVEGKAILFGMVLGEFSQGRNQDVAALMRQLDSLLKEEARSSVVLGVALQAMNTLTELEHEAEAREALTLTIAAFKDHQDPAVAAEAARLVEQAQFVNAEIEPKFNAVVAKREGAEDVFMGEMTKILAQPNVGSLTLEKGARFIGVLQQTGQYALARKLCEMYQNAYANTPDAELKEGAEQLTQMALRRLDLIGKPLVIEARRLDGVSLDFSLYQGKTVLVVFFGAFDPGCQQELMSIKGAYEKYHEQGFDVIGVSIDPNPQLLQQFLEQAKLPWLTVTNNELAKQCGADMLPFGVLLDPTGKVTDIFAQGALLRGKLEALFGAGAKTQSPAAQPLSPQGDQSRNAPTRTMRHRTLALVAAGLPALSGDEEMSGDEVIVSPASPARDDDDPEPQGPAGEPVLDEDEEQVNPYLAREGLVPAKLIDFLFAMQDKPKSIRRRKGFREAMVEAADRILRSDADPKYQQIATEVKLEVLHENACLGSEEADGQLNAFVQQLSGDKRAEIARSIEFFQLERRALEADQLDLKEVPTLLADLRRYLEAQSPLANRHLRMASATVHAINRLEDDKQREQQFTLFGSLFAKSDDRQLARYGKKLAGGGKGRASDVIGKPLELAGITDLGVPLQWDSYRGRVVLVDFWATWCGPCLREMPHVRAMYEELADSGFDVVAVSLDEDLEALAKYLEENKVPWTNLIGEDARELATKYEVRGIPTMMLVDKRGNVVAVGNKVESLKPQINQLLAKARP